MQFDLGFRLTGAGLSCNGLQIEFEKTGCSWTDLQRTVGEGSFSSTMIAGLENSNMEVALGKLILRRLAAVGPSCKELLSGEGSISSTNIIAGIENSNMEVAFKCN
jgi:hypothetical protein